MEFRSGMSQQHYDKTPVTFHNVAACFSEEEWRLLHEWQKELYRNVMKEIQQALISLGPLIAASVFSLRPKENEAPRTTCRQESERRHGTDHSARFPLFHPEMSSRKEEESSANLMYRPGAAGGESSISTRSGHPVISSVVSLHVQEEKNTRSMDRQCSERKQSTSHTSAGFPFQTDICMRNEQDSTTSLRDRPGAEKGESSTWPRSGPTHAGVEVTPQQEQKQYSEEPVDLVAEDTDDSSSTDNPIITSVYSLCHGQKEDMHSQGPQPQGPPTIKKKTRGSARSRTAFTCEQLQRLKAEFQSNRYISEQRRQTLAQEIHLNEYQIKIWFQNKRAKIKKATGLKNDLALVSMTQGLSKDSTTTVQDIEESE